jgi:hypothetical protein
MLFDKKRRIEGTSAVLIQSSPGGGKTHLARQYVYQHKDSFPGGIFWLQAGTEAELAAGFWDIARNAALVDRPTDEVASTDSLSSYIRSVKSWFNNRHEWLLVLDGVCSIDGLEGFIPDSPHTSLICTSIEQSDAFDRKFINSQIIRLPSLSAREAQMLLLCELDKKEPYNSDDLKYSMELVQAVGLLPIRIHAEAQRLRLTREPLSNFAKSSSSGPRLLGVYEPLVDQLKAGANFEALNLIYLVCFYSQHIPVEMISLGINILDVPVKTQDRIHGKSLNNSLEILNNFALVERNQYDPDVDASYNSQNVGGMLAENIDSIRLRSSVQSFFIHTLLVEGALLMWLRRAICVFCCSYDLASAEIDRKSNVGLAEDYRVYEIHGERLKEHLMRFNSSRRFRESAREQKIPLEDAQDLLSQRLLAIKEQIQNHTHHAAVFIPNVMPNIFETSVFDRTSSSTSGTVTPPDGAEYPPLDWRETGGSPLSPELITQHYRRLLSPSTTQFPRPMPESPGYDSDHIGFATLNIQSPLMNPEKGLDFSGLDAWEPVRSTQRPSTARSED